jgi:hypothetical protein
MDGRTNKNPPHGFWSFFRVALTEIAPLALRYKTNFNKSNFIKFYQFVKKSEVLAEPYRFRQNFRT